MVLMNDTTVVQVPVAAVKALGVVAKGMGTGFKQHAKSTGVTLLSKLKEKKLVDVIVVAVGQLLGPAMPLDGLFEPLSWVVFPKKQAAQKPPAHAQIAALQCTASALSRVASGEVTVTKETMKDVGKLCGKSITTISDPKVLRRMRMVWCGVALDASGRVAGRA